MSPDGGGVARVRYEKGNREATPLDPCLRRNDDKRKILITLWIPGQARNDDKRGDGKATGFSARVAPTGQG